MGERKLWVLSTEYNLYDQHGAYFCAAWLSKPTREQVRVAVEKEGSPTSAVLLDHILQGGGRRGKGHQWFNLNELAPGQSLDEVSDG